MSVEVMEGQVVHLETSKATNDPPIENAKDVLPINQSPELENEVSEGMYVQKSQIIRLIDL